MYEEQSPPEIVLMGSMILTETQPEVPMEMIGTETFRQKVLALKYAQEQAGGIGIAAPQVGWSARVMLLGLTQAAKTRYPQAPAVPFEVWINPEIDNFSSETCWAWEGCLSVPGLRGWIERPSTITVQGMNEKHQVITKTLDGFSARVFQHEMDHLNGILFPERVQNTRHIIPDDILVNQGKWAEEWPTPGARMTAPGSLSVLP